MHRLAKHTADRRRCRRRVSLLATEQRQARLRLIPPGAGFQESLFGRVEVPAQPMDLPLPVARPAAGQLVQHALVEPIRGHLGGVEGIGPRAVEFQDLGPVDLAQPIVFHHRRLTVTPPDQPEHPCPSMGDLEGVLAEHESVAIENAGDDRRQLLRRGRDDGLIDQAQPLLDAAHIEQRAGLVVTRQPRQVKIAEPLAHLLGSHRHGVATLEVPTAIAVSHAGISR